MLERESTRREITSPPFTSRLAAARQEKTDDDTGRKWSIWGQRSLIHLTKNEEQLRHVGINHLFILFSKDQHKEKAEIKLEIKQNLSLSP